MAMLIRYVLIAGVVSAVCYLGLYMMATHFEPEQKEVRKSLPGLTIKR